MNRPNKPNAFTILELLVATTLAAMAMVAVLQVTAAMASQQKALAQNSTLNPWQADLIELIRFDLANATDVATDSNQLIMSGLSAVDRTTLEPTQRPVQVQYVREASNLIRIQTSRDDTLNSRPWGEVIAFNVEQFSLKQVDRQSDDVSMRQYQLHIKWHDSNQQPLNALIVVR